MDRYSRSIVFSLLTVLGLTLAAVAVSLFLPFEVEQPVIIQRVTGIAELHSDTNPPATPSGETQLAPGETVQVQPGGVATIIFDLNEGRAIVTGPAALTLIESYRRATALGHMLDSEQFEREYVLTLEQTGGSIRYLFDDTTPPFEDTTISIRLPSGSYTPQSPCWVIDINTEGQVTTQDINCAS
jgi:hypothetical protein